MLALLSIFLIGLSLYALWHSLKPLPEGLAMRGEKHQLASDHIRFLTDLTAAAPDGSVISEQQIFPALFKLIAQAENYILLDFFLLNDLPGRYNREKPSPLAAQLVQNLVARKRQRPELIIDVITDPINRVYSDVEAPTLTRLQAAGANLIVTDLTRLRDSNPLYSVWWRLLLRWVPDWGSYLPHPFTADGSRVSLASWLQLINFKANHRKVALADRNGRLVSLVTSANPHGPSAQHSNVALLIESNRLASDLHLSEQAVARMSGGRLHPLPSLEQRPLASERARQMSVQLLTEARIQQAVCDAIDRTSHGDKIRLAMFYLADRQVIQALLSAAWRGAQIELILDPNRDAFGYSKQGIPNRPVAAELKQQSAGKIAIRWYHTHGEQFHTKLLLIEYDEGKAALVLGSANLTRRNLANYNLETDLRLEGPADAPTILQASDYFARLWHNQKADYTRPYSAYAEESRWIYLRYRLQEALGLGTF